MRKFYPHEKYEHKRRPVGPRPGYPSANKALDAAMDQYLAARGLDPTVARFNHWFPSSDAGDSHPRIVIPGSNSFGYVYWQARYIGNDPEVKRYQSVHASRENSVILAWPAHRFTPDTTIVSEGPMDALAAAEVGAVGVAMMGNNPPADCVEYIARILRGTDRWIITPDQDDLKFGGDLVAAFGMLGIKAVLMLSGIFGDFAKWPRHQRRDALWG